MNLSCYIVDDESHALNLLRGYVEKTPGLSLCGSTTRPLEALDAIPPLFPDLVFLDVDMPELNGLRLAVLLNKQSTVIFTTAYREYGPEAFENEAADYLLKPISYERFLACIQKIRRNLAARAAAAPAPLPYLFVKSGIKEKLLQVTIADILYISGNDHYIEIHTTDQKIVTYMKMSDALGKLPEHQFSRIHKTFIVNHHFITTLEPGQVKLRDQTTLPVGRAFKAAFREKIAGTFPADAG
ncbi:MAG: LytTR family DNA-binding domain-containing protein [Bacteroidota bacterium]|nr:LytTR family DNA-binding domain-containing protein [Bacteroidota bacterium]